MRRVAIIAAVTFVLTLIATATGAVAQEAPAEAPARPVVLDASSLWRFHHELAAPKIQTAGGGTKPLLIGTRWFDAATAEAPADWTDPGFDDSLWLHGGVEISCNTPYTARLQARGAFSVDDPTKVRGLRLSVAYHGGVVVSINGRRIATRRLAGPEAALSEGYPKSAFTNADGKLLTYRVWRGLSRQGKDGVKAIRRRQLDDVVLPAKHLRRGRNVVAIEVVAAPNHAVVDEQKLTRGSEIKARGTAYDLSWSTCRLLDASLTADTPAGLATDPEEPALVASNSSPLVGDPTAAVGGPGLRLRPVRLVAPRNGAANGVVVVAGKGAELSNLKAAAGDLAGPGGRTIKGSEVRVRYAGRWDQRGRGRTWIPRDPDILLASPPAKVGDGPLPVWITVAAPLSATPGQYTGVVTLSVKGARPVKVPLELTVAGWAFPSPGKQRTWIELMQCPDALSMEYGVDLWSKEHWRLIDRSFELIGAIGSRTVYLPLICRTNIGNAESMVRWIDRGKDKPLEYDFSRLDRYLDIALKHIKEPKIVGLYVWDVYFRAGGRKPKPVPEEKKDDSRPSRHQLRWDPGETGPAVTMVRPDGTLSMVRLPRLEDPRSVALWKPVFDGLRKRLKQRGIEDKAALAMFSDWRAKREEVAALKTIAGDLPWVKHSHGGSLGYGRSSVYNLSHIVYEANVWNLQFNPEPVTKPSYGWRRNVLVTEFDRFGFWNHWPAGSMRHILEFNVTGHQRGVGRIGADYWPTMRDKRGQRIGRPVDRYPEVYWHNTNVYSMLLAPGREGPVASVRYERTREGLQECEARIAIERVLVDPKLRGKVGDAMVRRCRDVLDRRSVAMWKAASEMNLSARGANRMSTSANKKATTFSRHVGGVTGHRWFTSSDWQGRALALYTLAAEVTAATGK